MMKGGIGDSATGLSQIMTPVNTHKVDSKKFLKGSHVTEALKKLPIGGIPRVIIDNETSQQIAINRN
jgi:hypothetical protein